MVFPCDAGVTQCWLRLWMICWCCPPDRSDSASVQIRAPLLLPSLWAPSGKRPRMPHRASGLSPSPYPEIHKTVSIVVHLWCVDLLVLQCIPNHFINNISYICNTVDGLIFVGYQFLWFSWRVLSTKSSTLET